MYLNYKKAQECMDRNIEDVFSFHSVTVKKKKMVFVLLS